MTRFYVFNGDADGLCALEPVRQVPGATVVVLPDAAWARRAIGVLANDLTQAQPDCAIATLSPNSSGGYTVSVRVPAQSPVAADESCRGFDTGGGRKLAQRRAGSRHAEQHPKAGKLQEMRSIMRYAIVIENAGPNYSAYVPDLPGCVATGATAEEVEREIREAIEFHLEGLLEDGFPIPAPSSAVRYVDIAAS